MTAPVVLLVEDDDREARIVKLIIERAGALVERAGSMEEAREVVARSPGIAGAIVDVLLPDGDGLQLVAELHEACSTLPVVVTTGLCEAEIARRIFELDARYLVKPYCARQLTDFAAQIIMGGFDPLGARLEAAARMLAKRAALTAVDEQVLLAVAIDDRRGEVQRALEMKLPTLKRHLERIFERTGAQDLRHLGAMVRRLALDWAEQGGVARS